MEMEIAKRKLDPRVVSEKAAELKKTMKAENSKITPGFGGGLLVYFVMEWLLALVFFWNIFHAPNLRVFMVNLLAFSAAAAVIVMMILKKKAVVGVVTVISALIVSLSSLCILFLIGSSIFSPVPALSAGNIGMISVLPILLVLYNVVRLLYFRKSLRVKCTFIE